MLATLRSWLGSEAQEGARQRSGAQALHAAIVAAARRPALFVALGVPDSLDGRFEAVALHAWLALRRLRAAPDDPARRAERALAQDLVDVLIRDFDRSLREMGAGDLGVGRRVKDMAKAMNGRIAAYDAGLDAPGGAATAGPAGAAGAAEDALQAALRRNLYGTVAAPDPGQVAAVAAYLREAAAALSGSPLADLAAGRLPLPPLPVPGARSTAEAGDAG
ncbi:MAG: ubiquinol-cytochrome C chaperone family protein [Alphaproteobacteria bacterium]|nr:ubiquinol-cytochrome C chaperone family protein [Alphaproteobacteria bacterium]